MSADKVSIDEANKVLIEARVQILRETILRELRQCKMKGRSATVGRLVTTCNYMLGSAPVWWQLLRMRDEGLITFDGEPHRIQLEAEIEAV